MTARARSFLAANEASPVVYGSVDEGRVTYRLADGKMFRLSIGEARQAANPRWAFVAREADAKALGSHREEERELLERLVAEARPKVPEGGWE